MKIFKSKTLITILFVFIILNPIFFSNFTIAQNNEVTVHEVLVQNNRFVPNELSIEVGDIVKFVWTEGAEGHNVLQTNSSTSTNYNEGFASGSPQNYPFNWTLPTQYTSTDVTLFYICLPHVSSGMRGTIIVGEGSVEISNNNTAIWISIIIGTILLSVGFIIVLRKLYS